MQGPVSYLHSDGPLASSGAIAGSANGSIVAVMSSSLGTPGTFALDNLTVDAGNTPGTAFRTSAFARAADAAPRRAVVDAEARGTIPDLRARLISARGDARLVRDDGVLPHSLHVGSTAQVWVEHGNSGQSSQVAATLVAQSAHGNIWLDDALLGGPAAANAAQIAADFENAYASDTQHFASPDYPANAPGLSPRYQACNANAAADGTTPAYIAEPADHRVDVMIVDASALDGFGGYFSSENLMPQAALNCVAGAYHSNEAPFIFVGWFGFEGASYELNEDLVRGTAHELQHLINFVNHAILPPAAAAASFDGEESTYINEGLSMLAQGLAVQRMWASRGVQTDVDDALERAGAYLANPGNFSIAAFTGIDDSSWGGSGSAQSGCFGGCYGGAYLFQRYLRSRFGGDGYTRAIETSGQVGAKNLQAVTGESAGDLLDDFALAMAASTLGISNAGPRFSLGSLDLSGTYADQFGGSLRLHGVSAPSIAGATAQVRAPIGGFAYVSVPAVPASGAPVTVTDSATASGFALAAGLAQL